MRKIKKYILGLGLCLLMGFTALTVGCTNGGGGNSGDGGTGTPPTSPTAEPVAKVALDMSLDEYQQYFAFGKQSGDSIASTYGTTTGTIEKITDATYGDAIKLNVQSSGTATQVGFRLAGVDAWKNKLTDGENVVFYVYNPMKIMFGPYLRITTGDGSEMMEMQDHYKGSIFLDYGWNRVEITVAEFTKVSQNGGQFYMIFGSPLGKRYEREGKFGIERGDIKRILLFGQYDKLLWAGCIGGRARLERCVLALIRLKRGRSCGWLHLRRGTSYSFWLEEKTLLRENK